MRLQPADVVVVEVDSDGFLGDVSRYGGQGGVATVEPVIVRVKVAAQRDGK